MQSTLVAAILLRNEIYATLPKLKRDVTGRHYNVSLARAPCRLARGDS